MFWTRLSKELYATIHGRKLTIAELSAATDLSESLLYRSALAYTETPSATPPSLRLVILVMKATRDFRVLKFICNYFGFICLRLPRVGRNKKDNLVKISELQELHAVTIQYLLEYARNPTKDSQKNSVKSLYLCIEYQTGIIRDLRYNFHQLELPF